MLGDSSSFGWGVDYEKTYSSLLVGKLNASSLSVLFKLRNLSLPGFSSFQGKLLWQELDDVKNDDWVILSFGWNDSFPSHQTDRQQFESRNSLMGKINWNFRQILFFRWMRTWRLPESGLEYKEGSRVPLTQYREKP